MQKLELEDIFLSAAAETAWGKIAEKAAEILDAMKVTPEMVPDEEVLLKEDGTLLLRVVVPGKFEIQMDIPASEWGYQQ